ncbi:MULTISPECIES: non-ribosomal peptide synthetase [Rhodococcus]|nr:MULTISPECIES: non-ribosomal peptide synthetase [Rhodococcus]MDV7241304.1 amino acid adenylation domain-containing protein [Rhodococcus oxybenzonivorans]MDV7274163.1 amino acid adenylation domain-containing protein [Rhodococcus oxybenzonivorans]MDV7333584.1 amino acid adenylation domain-containing protein [Rhodococcus oxybenzonivorans]MDV7343004.1 amino acid adenylation domain-containing protein [Rhodococcus oxybenzonivorans]MDV8028216.1 amino acid adenylation domain-containing protein [Rhod
MSLSISSPSAAETAEGSTALCLTAAQCELWVGHQLDETGSAYTTAEYVDIDGTVDIGALTRAVRTVIDEAEVLSVRFDAEPDAEPVDVLQLHDHSPEVETLELSRDAALEWMRADVRRPLDLLSARPLLRTAVIRVDTGALWYLRAPHVLLDAYGYSLLTRRVAALYTAFHQGTDPRPARFPTLRDHVEQARQLDSALPEPQPRASTSVTFTDTTRRPTADPHRVALTLGPDVSTGLRDSASAHGATWADAVYAAAAGYLAAHTGADEVTLRVPLLARTGVELASPVTATNVVPLRVSLGGRPTFGDVIARTTAELTKARPFQRVRNTHRSAVGGPVVNVKPFDATLRFGPSRGVIHQVATGPVDDVVISVTGAGDHLALEWAGNPLVYSADEIRVHLHRFAQYLERLSSAPGPVVTVDLCADDEWALWQSSAGLHRTQQADADADADAETIVSTFLAQAGRHADRRAVNELTYRALACRSGILARRLQDAGAGRGTVVAVSLPMGTELIVAILAVLRCGATYLPIDPSSPAERVRFILEDAEPTLAIGSTELLGHLPRIDHHVTETEPSTYPDSRVRAGDIAYIIYTSGSTGVPKGVPIPHRNVMRLFAASREWFTFTADDCWPLLHSYAFDFSVWEMWGALLHGGRLVTVPEDVVTSPADLAALLVDEGVTVLNQTPSAFGHLVDALDAEGARERLRLRYVVFGGEALDPAVLRSWFAAGSPGDTELINMYGITETTVHVTAARVTTPDSLDIGVPLRDLRTYVLGPGLRPVPPGITGEIYVSGPGVSPGYLGRRGLTASRFVADPFVPGGERMYRTGDLARYDATGSLDYRGRIDDQIQLRGYRVELGEITAAMTAVSGVRAAVATVYAPKAGDDRIVGYVVPEPGTDPDDIEDVVRGHLIRTLPGYMTPSTLMLLDRLPLTSHGKVDKAALPVPRWRGASADGPRTDTEHRILPLFTAVLGAEQIGIHDDFFTLGGNSLLAAALVSSIGAELGVALRVATIFDNPTVAAVAARVDETGRTGTASGPFARTIPEGTAVPLSPAQERLWFLDSAAGGGTYLLGLAVDFDVAPDSDALTLALADVVTRHQSLRTVFPLVDSVPHQVVLPAEQSQVRLERVGNIGNIEAHISAITTVGLGLAEQPPLRAVLYEPQHTLVLLIHHIIGDEWSQSKLLGDLAFAYNARRAGRPPVFEPLPLQYPDVAVWQRERASGGRLDYWEKQLAGLPLELGWRTDRPRPALPTHRGASVHRTLPPSLHAAIEALATERRASFFMIVHAAVAVLLERLGAGEDIALGVPVAGRSHPDLDGMVGCFVNTVVLRTDVSGAPTFDELLDRVRRVDLEAVDHSDVPFNRIVELVNPPRSSARHPLFQVMLSHWKDDGSPQRFDGTESSVRMLDATSAKFDLALRFQEHAGQGGVDVTIEYSTELFDDATVDSLADRLVVVIERLVARHDESIARLDILTDVERAQVLGTWSHRGHSIEPRTFDEYFSAQVARTPDAEALAVGRGVRPATSLSYGELDARANMLARLLIARGAGPGDVVALALDRSAELIVAVLAVLKSGAAYLPIDPTYPADRIAHMLADGSPVAVVTSSVGVPDRGALGTGVPLIDLDDPEVRTLLSAHPAVPVTDRDRIRPLRLDDAAYLIYTSGSTGVPKGVVVPHRGIADLLSLQSDVIGMDSTTRALHFSSISFDLAFWQIMWGLLSGGTLVVATDADRVPGEPLARVIRDHRVNFVGVPPSFAAAFPPEHSIPDGVDLMLGAEKLPAQLIERYAPGRRLFNAYGPTECTVNATLALVRPGHEGPVPIGVIDPGKHAYVLDSGLRPVPPGVSGELYLAGASVTQGYRHQSTRTAERFVADPFGDPGTRMYRTSDVVWWGRDGQIYFTGRADTQVKVRGFRIELNEIESVLAGDPDVEHVVVVVREDRPGDQRLVAYATSVPGGRIDPDQLHRRAASRLPDYMIPAAFIAVEEFPTLPNGKLDQSSLPVPHLSLQVSERGPRTAREEVLCQLFAEALGLERVGIDDSFFDLGGHSLMAAGLMSEISKRLSVTATVASLFAAPTVAQLAGRLDDDSDADALAVLLPFRTEGSRPPVFCFHPAGGISWGYSGLLRHIDSDYPLYGVQASNLSTSSRPPETLQDMAAEYLEHMRAVRPTGPYHLLGWSLGGVVAHAIAGALQEQGDELGMLVMLDSFPSDAWASMPTEQDALAALLYMVGYDPEPLLAEGLTRQRVIDILRGEGSALAGINEHTPAAMIDNFANAVRLESEPSQIVVNSDLLFFTAARNPATAATHRLWEPFVNGTIVNHDLDCEHKDMTQPRWIGEVGTVVNEALAAFRSHTPQTHQVREQGDR